METTEEQHRLAGMTTVCSVWSVDLTTFPQETPNMQKPKIQLAKVYKSSEANEAKLRKYLFTKEKLSPEPKL
jgi:hypothetical protein